MCMCDWCQPDGPKTQNPWKERLVGWQVPCSVVQVLHVLFRQQEQVVSYLVGNDCV